MDRYVGYRVAHPGPVRGDSHVRTRSHAGPRPVADAPGRGPRAAGELGCLVHIGPESGCFPCSTMTCRRPARIGCFPTGPADVPRSVAAPTMPESRVRGWSPPRSTSSSRRGRRLAAGRRLRGSHRSVGPPRLFARRGRRRALGLASPSRNETTSPTGSTCPPISAAGGWPSCPHRRRHLDDGFQSRSGPWRRRSVAAAPAPLAL